MMDYQIFQLHDTFLPLGATFVPEGDRTGLPGVRDAGDEVFSSLLLIAFAVPFFTEVS